MGRIKNKTLSCFVGALQGVQVIVELRNDTIIRGLLESADDGLNLVLNGVTVQKLQGRPTNQDFMFVKGSTIRYIHVPKAVKVATVVEDQARRVAALRTMDAVQRGSQPRIAKGVACDGGITTESIEMAD
eukprot:jgi/Botrbrau1/1176/Bobra.0162s0061.2